MAAQSNLDQLNGMFKQLYADKVKELVPDGVKLMKKIGFAANKRIGDFYNQPVNLTQEHGFTYGGENGGAFTLNSAVAGTTKNSQVRGTEIVLRSVIPFGPVLRSATTMAAFAPATKYVVGNMLNSFYKLMEVDLLYGQKGLADVGSVAGNVITIDAADWAPGIWAGAKDKPLEIRSSAGAFRGYCNVSSVDLSARTVTVDAVPAGVIANDIIWHRGAYGNQFAGVHSIISTSGSLFGIDNSSYELWKGNSATATGALSFAKLAPGLAQSVAKGLDGEVSGFVSNVTWDDLMVDLAAKRSIDQSYKPSKGETGFQEIQFHSQNGLINVTPSIYVKQGHAFLLDLKSMERIGSTDITFDDPDMQGKYMKVLENQHGYDVRAYTDQALFCNAPGRNTLITGFTNSN
jgi:hypothetical protein